MYSLDELADELNREEWAVERMLKNRGYLKKDGDPRKSTIDDGLMNKNGLITKSGWETFIDELGYKESDDDDDEDDEIEEECDEDEDEEDEDSDDDSDDDVEDEIRTELESSFSDSDVIEELIPDLVSMYEHLENSSDYDDAISSVKDCIGTLASYYNSDGHSIAFLKTALVGSDYELWMEREDSIYSEMGDDEIREDIEHLMDFFDFSDATKEFMEKEMADGGLDESYFDTAKEFEENYQEALEECGDEYMASRYSELKIYSYQLPEAVCEPSKSLGSCCDDSDVEEFIEEKYGVEVLTFSDGEVTFIDDSILVVATFDIHSEELSDSSSFYLDTEKNRNELGV